MGKSTRRLVESAVMIAIGTVLSMFPFSAPWAFGGGVTICSMLPLVIIAHRYGTKWGLFTAFVYSVLQLILGVSNVQFAAGYGFVLAVGVLLLDYILAFTVIGLSACFNGVIKNHLCFRGGASCSPLRCVSFAIFFPVGSILGCDHSQ